MSDWLVYTNEAPKAEAMSQDSLDRNMRELRGNDRYQVLIDQPDFVMWRWNTTYDVSFDGLLICYIKKPDGKE